MLGAGKFPFVGESPLTIRARCVIFRYRPNPLGIVFAMHKFQFVSESKCRGDY